MVVGRLVSFCDGLFSLDMFNFKRIYSKAGPFSFRKKKAPRQPEWSWGHFLSVMEMEPILGGIKLEAKMSWVGSTPHPVIVEMKVYKDSLLKM